MKEFIGMSGFLNLISGISLLIYWYSFAVFMPYRELSNTLVILVKNRHWKWINTLGVLGATAGLLGQAGILIVQIDYLVWQPIIGFFLATLGTLLIIGTMLWDTILWPILVNHDESLLSFQGPIYTSKTFLPFFIVSGLIYAFGYIFVGIGIIQSNILPSTTGYLLAIGAPTFGLGSMFGKFQIYPRTIGVTLMSIGLIWIGISMLL